MKILISEMKRTISDTKKKCMEDVKTGMFFYNLMHMSYFMSSFCLIGYIIKPEVFLLFAIKFSIFGAINYIVYMVIRLYSLYKNKR